MVLSTNQLQRVASRDDNFFFLLQLYTPCSRIHTHANMHAISHYRVQTRPSLLIGNHLLESKIAALPKPYAVLVRNRASTQRGADLNADADAIQVDSDADAAQPVLDDAAPAGSGEVSSPRWAICGIVKKKIVFSKRPMPVMAKKL